MVKTNCKNIKRMIDLPDHSEQVPDSLRLNPNLSSIAVLIGSRCVGLMNVSLNKGMTFYDWKRGRHFIILPTKDLINSRPDFTKYKVEKALNELEDNGFIERAGTFRSNKIFLPKYEPYYRTRKPAQHPMADNHPLGRTVIKRPYRTKSKRTKISTCNTRNTGNRVTKSDKHIYMNLKLKETLENTALSALAETTNDHTGYGLTKIVKTIKAYSFGSSVDFYHYFSLFFRAKKSILNKLRKKPGMSVYKFKLYKQGLTFELNSLFNTKEAAHKVYKIIWHAGKMIDKSKDHKGRDRYIMFSFQNLLSTYAFNYVLDKDNNDKGPDIPLDVFDNDDSVAE